MNFENSKENIQPLAAGRNVEQLEIGLNAESDHECQERLQQQRRQFEHDIHQYVGDDPIDLWFDYVLWLEQSYPKSGKEAALDELLKKCLSLLEKDGRYGQYKQDPRLIRLFIKYIDTKRNPHLFYEKLYKDGIGTMVADLYIAWAHYFDILDDFEQAKLVYQKGLDARAEPIDQLEQAYNKFQFSVGQRIVRKEEYRQEFLTTMEQQRNAFTSLHSLKRSKVGSIRTGSAIKSFTPGQVKQSQPRSSSAASNAPMNVYEGSSSQAKAITQPQRFQSVVEQIEHSAVENNIEPGPWTRASCRKSVYHNVSRNNRDSTLKLEIFEDNIAQPTMKFGPLPPDDGNLASNLPKNFVRKNEPQTAFVVAAYVEDTIEENSLVCYPKPYLHPNEKVSFQPEELCQYLRLTKQNISNDFTRERGKYWAVGGQIPTRILANFPRSNKPQTDMVTERPDISLIPNTENFLCRLDDIYPEDSITELSADELRSKIFQNNADDRNDGMDETVCVRGRQSIGVAYTRNATASGARKSIMPLPNHKGFDSRHMQSMTNEDCSSDMEIDDENENNERSGKVAAVVQRVENRTEDTQSKMETISAVVPVERKGFELPKTQWSIYTDDEPKVEQIASSSKPNSIKKEQTEDLFAVPQVPMSRPGNFAEKRTVESMSTKNTDIEAPSRSTLPERSPYPIGPHTGAVRKSIRKSLAAENSIQTSTSGNNTFKSPTIDLDYSLCTQAFNVNLAEQMVSTPVSIRRTEPLLEQIRAQDTQPLQPLKLSTIMETTEGSSTHTTSTKSSTQFSSPEDDDVSKRLNRTKIGGATVCTDDDAADGLCRNDSMVQPMEDIPVNSFVNVGATNYPRNVEKTLTAIQMSLLSETVPVVQNPVGALSSTAAKEVLSKNYPFPIFEDTQTMDNLSPQPECLPKPFMPIILAGTHPNQPSPNDSQNANHSNDGQFNMTSFWIKDEPQSYASKDSGAEESFAMPSVRENKLSVESGRMIMEETGNNFGNDSKAQSADGSMTEESFALPNVRENKRNVVGDRINHSGNDAKEQPQMMDGSTTEESFALPNVPPIEPLSQRRRTIFVETHSPQMDHGSVIEESFALPNTNRHEAERSSADVTSELDGSSSSEEEEVILVPDDTIIEDVPKIAHVESLAPHVVGEHRFDMSTRISISLTEEEIAAHVHQKNAVRCATDDDHHDVDANGDQSIYFKHNSIVMEPSWTEDEPVKLDVQSEVLNEYQHEEVDLEESRILIDTKLAQSAVDPFDEVLKNALLQELKFVQNTLEKNGSSELVSTVPTVTVKRTIQFQDTHFDVLKCIGHGAYGRVYSVRCAKDGKVYAVKKEKPANIWECYILTQVHRRISGDVLSGYMRIDMSIIGNDGSLLFSEYSPYGTLLDICNKVFTSIKNNVNETIVFILAYQMLELVDQLHRAGILHLDLKPDNFLVMKPMSSNHKDLFIQLIDFGNSIDLHRFPPEQQFNAQLETKHFVCIEMLEQRPWIHQPDLFCLAATIHSVLFGRYMDVRKIGPSFAANVTVPRYFNNVWKRFFNELINVPAGTKPNLLNIKLEFHRAIIGDSNLERKIIEFNQFIR